MAQQSHDGDAKYGANDGAQESGAGYGNNAGYEDPQKGGGMDGSGGTGGDGDQSKAGSGDRGEGVQGPDDQAVQRSETLDADSVEFDAEPDLIDDDE